MIKRIKQALRLFHINLVLARNGLDAVLISMGMFRSFRYFIYLNPWNWSRKTISPGQALRQSLEELGPIFVKLGQALSTRPDLLPTDVAEELAKLQDSVPPFPAAIAVQTIETAFGQPIVSLFADFDTNVLASASIAQVHAATLKTGESVVVKVLRPGIRKLIENDLSLMMAFATLIDRYWPLSQRFKPKEIVQEFETHLLDELDLQREAGNAAQLRRNFEGSSHLYVPQIYWDYTRETVLVMERIHGIPVTDIHTLKAYGVDLKKLAERGVEIFFTQVFRDCFFHADMHPGNIFVSPQHPQDPQYICVDFGIMGTLNDSDKQYLAENFLAFFNRDYKRIALLHIESGWIERSSRVEDFESAVRTICEPIFNKPLQDISFGKLMWRLLQVARRFNMPVQPQLILLQKTLVAIEGLGRQLYPQLDLWTTAKPFLEQWVHDQIGLKAFFRQIKSNLPFITTQLPNMPKLLYEVLMTTKAAQQKEETHPKSKNRASWLMWFWGFGVGVGFSIAVVGTYHVMLNT